MQWTNGSGEAYGEDPYGAAGYAYAYGHEGGGALTDTATPTWDPVQSAAQWTQPYSTTWDAPGDVLTVPPPQFDTQPFPFVPEPEPWSGPGPQVPENEPARPVFVDASGRRQRRVLRAARLLLIPAGGYVALLISTLLGGPGLSAPFVPQPDTAPRATVPDSPSGAGHRAGSESSTATDPDSRSTVQKTASGPTAHAVTSGPTAAPTGTISPASGTAASPAPAPITTHRAKGRALGSSHKPVK